MMRAGFTGRRAFALVVTAALAAVGYLASLLIGPTGLGVPEGEAGRIVLSEIRLPRAILGFLVGGSLGLSGAVLQGYLRNPLAEPGLLGVTGGASLGAVIAIHTGLSATFAVALPLGGLLGAMAATLALLALAGERSGALTLILAGVAISAIAAALTALALNLTSNPFASVEIMFWMMGSLTDRSLVHVYLAAPLILLGCAMLVGTGRALDALALGEEAAENLGADLRRLRFRIVAGITLGVGAATAVAGAIGFVGLIVPHLLRPLVGHEPRRLLLPSFFGGAFLVLLADVVLRVLSPAGDLRLGVVTALAGAPFFLWLVLRSRRELAP